MNTYIVLVILHDGGRQCYRAKAPTEWDAIAEVEEHVGLASRIVARRQP